MPNRFSKWSWRVYPMWLLLTLGLALLVSKLVSLQLDTFEQGKTFLQGQGDARVIRDVPIAASRGEIVDRHGELLAYSTPVKSIFARPTEIARDESSLKAVAKALGMTVTTLQKRLMSNDRFVYLKRQIQPAKADAIMAQQFLGIYSETEYQRFYPAGEVASHLIGFTNVDDQGQEGVELAFDQMLRSVDGSKRVMKNARSEVIKDIKLNFAPKNGQAIQLSIDMKLQFAAYRELKAAVNQYQARSGSLVILDVETGEVLALVNQPSYNANDRRQMKPERLRNRALIDLYEPGSTVKPFTVAAALESGRFQSSAVIDTSPGSLRVDDKMVVDTRDYGELNLTSILSKSSNVGTVKLALALESDQMRDVFSRVGFGEFCATGYPGEQAGYLPNHRNWDPIQQATLSFGHGLSVSTLQLARAYSVLANDGIKKPVSLLKQYPADSNNKSESDSAQNERVLSVSVAKQVREMMTAVVEKGGTGTKARVAGYSIAGKTGTAHKVGVSGYEDHRYRATFAGIAPASNPKLVAVVTINDPRGEQYFGGEIAAPVFGRVMSDALRLLNITPDRLDELGVEVATSKTALSVSSPVLEVRDIHGGA